jgi:hypothetical protein
VPLLVIKEYMRFENTKDSTFVNAAKEEGVIDCDSPGLEAGESPLMRGRVSSRDDGDVQSNSVRCIGGALRLFSPLNLVDLL